MILKHRDKELLRFDWVDDARVRIASVNDRERRLLPLDFGADRQDEDPDALRYRLEDWLMTRSAPVGRHFMRDLMDSIGLNINSPAYHRKALDFSKGLSLNDVYWVVPDDFPGAWSECNLYDNAFSEALAEIANQLEMTIRQVERVIASLKRKAGLKRRGSDKVGEWCFE